MRTALVVILCGLMMGGCSWINEKMGLRDNNLFEEWAEEQIRQEIGLDLDLTPQTPEDNV